MVMFYSSDHLIPKILRSFKKHIYTNFPVPILLIGNHIISILQVKERD